MQNGVLESLYAGAAVPLLNERAFYAISCWFKFTLRNLPLTEIIGAEKLYQHCRPIDNTVDGSSIEPAIADLMAQIVEKTLMPIVRVAVCASAVAAMRVTEGALNLVRNISQSETVFVYRLCKHRQKIKLPVHRRHWPQVVH